MNTAEQDPMIFQRSPWARGPMWIPVPKWIRVSLGGEYIGDSKRVMLWREFPPTYYFPRQDVNMEFLSRSDKSEITQANGKKIYYHINTGEREVKNAAWCYEEPGNEAPERLEDYIAFEWDAMDAWWEEAEPIRVHPRDPYTRIDTIHSSRHVRILMEGVEVAESNTPVLLFETGLPVRFYLRKTDVRMDLLKMTGYKTRCPYKGTATYYSAMINGREAENIAWSYPYPAPDMFKIQDLITFHSERLEDFYVEGKRLPKVTIPRPE